MNKDELSFLFYFEKIWKKIIASHQHSPTKLLFEEPTRFSPFLFSVVLSHLLFLAVFTVLSLFIGLFKHKYTSEYDS